MRISAFSYLCLAGIALVGCTSAEDQQKFDMQACSSYGFQAGSNEFANCMLQTAQRRQADQAAQQRQQSYNDTVSQQAQKDREAKAAAQDAQASAAREADVQRMMNSTSPTFIPSDAVTKTDVTTPTIPSIDTSNMKCTSTTAGNAGQMSCTSN